MASSKTRSETPEASSSTCESLLSNGPPSTPRIVATSARPRHLADEPLTPWVAATRMVECAAKGEIALVFGSERVGLTNQELELWTRASQIEFVRRSLFAVRFVPLVGEGGGGVH